MKPISTAYAGYRFRSRLEARWAVFFDCLAIPYAYESEGYHLDTVRYLPDFVLNPATHPIYCEIKPPGEPTAGEREKARKLSHESARPVYILCGDPYAGLVAGVSFAERYTPASFSRLTGEALVIALFMGYSRMAIETAATAAREARFEHGEMPQVAPIVLTRPNRVYDGPVTIYALTKSK